VSKEEKLAEYIVGWLISRNGAELREVFDGMTVRDFKSLKVELVMILEHGGKPPNWVG
jgi:hypothetical protein